MSRFRRRSWTRVPSFPRVSGDEPARQEREDLESEFSPRERG